MSSPALPPEISVLFSRDREGWRLYADGWVAPFVRQKLDAHREAYPVCEPDLADLERYMWKLDAPYVRRSTSVGGSLIEAKGRSAIVSLGLLRVVCPGKTWC
jgi:hypothetical protein